MQPTVRAIQAPATYRALDGGVLRVDAPDHQLTCPWSASVRCSSSRGEFGFQSSVPGSGALAMRPLAPDFAFTREYTYLGRPLRVGYAAVPNTSGEAETIDWVWMGEWEGGKSCLYTFLQVPEGVVPGIEGLFMAVQIAEVPDGIRLAPAGAGRLELYASSLVVDIEDLGVVDLTSRREREGIVPAWGGHARPRRRALLRADGDRRDFPSRLSAGG